MKTKVLVFINYINKASETFISDELDFLSKQKDVELDILHYGKDIPDINVHGLNLPHSSLKRIKKNPSKFSLNFLRSLKFRNGLNGTLGYLIDFFKNKNYDTIYCHFGTNGKLIAELKDLGIIPSSTKLVVRFHGLDMNFTKYPVGFYDILIVQANYILAGSSYSIEKLKKYKIEISKIVKLPVGIKDVFISKMELASQRPSINKLRILAIGRLIPLKGFEEAIEIISKLVNKDKIEFEIIGEGAQKTILDQKIKHLGLEHSILLAGQLSHLEVLEKLNSSDIYIYTGKVDKEGRAEAQGLANIEAMALGNLIIAFDVGGISDYVVDNSTGFLIEPGNLEEFANRLDYVIENYDDQKIQTIKMNSFNHVRKHYCQENLNSTLLNILIKTHE